MVRLFFDCEEAIFKNINFTDNCIIYNVFEYVQTKTPIKKVKMENVKVFPSLTHNVLNLYNIADDAIIEVPNCDFGLNISNTNLVRLSNLSNASNVTVTFKNVNQTYDNMNISEDSKKQDGLILIQPFNTDKASNKWKDTVQTLDFYKSWTFIFDNCTYNGKKQNQIILIQKNKLFVHMILMLVVKLKMQKHQDIILHLNNI